MALTVRSKRKNTTDDGAVNGLGERVYSVTFEVDQTDGGALAAPGDVLIAAQALAGTSDPTARIPLVGEEYDFDDFEDTDSFLQNIRWRRRDPTNDFKLWTFTCEYGPARQTDPGVFTEPDPLLWPAIYDIDFVEEQVPLEEAAIVENLSHIGRAADSIGPVVNSCGVEFTEGLLKTVYHPILIVVKNYATLDEIIALNLAFQNTQNDDTFFGAAARKAKYLSTASGGRQQVNGQAYYPGTTRIWFKDATWDRLVLNNGWSHFERFTPEGESEKYREKNGKPVLFKNKVFDAPPSGIEDEDVAGDPDTDCSEPLNLQLNGTLQPADDVTYLTYRDLAEADYAGIGIGG